VAETNFNSDAFRKGVTSGRHHRRFEMDQAFAHGRQCWGTRHPQQGKRRPEASLSPRLSPKKTPSTTPDQDPGTKQVTSPPPPRQPTQTHPEGHRRVGCHNSHKAALTATTLRLGPRSWSSGDSTSRRTTPPPAGYP
jgi:hypothetical protein